MTDVSQQEDLSKLKGPSKWWVVLFLVATTILVVYIRWLFLRIGWRGQAKGWEILVALCTIVGCMASLLMWVSRNHSYQRVRYWKDTDGAWRVIAKSYPEKATGPVIEVQVKASPRFRLMWGGSGWSEDAAGASYANFVNRRGSRLDFANDRKALATAGLTLEVVEFLCNAGRRWKIVPLDAGRTLRFVDRNNCGIEVRYTELIGIDLEQILRSQDCADYHRRMQEKKRIHDIAEMQAGEAMVKLGLPSPSDSLPLVHRLGRVEDVATAVKESREQAWRKLCWALAILRQETEKHAGRTKSAAYFKALQRERDLLAFLHEQLPLDDSRRQKLNILPEELTRLDTAIAALNSELAPPTTVSGQGG